MSNDISSLSAYGKIQNSFLNNVKEKIELQFEEEVFDFSNIEQNIDIDASLEKPVENEDKSIGVKLKEFFSNIADVIESVFADDEKKQQQKTDPMFNINSLYYELADSTTDAERNYIQAQIDVLSVEQERETLTTLYDNLKKSSSDEEYQNAIKDLEAFQDLQKQRAFEEHLNGLYSNMANATTEAQRTSIQSQIDSLLNEQSVNYREGLQEKLANATSIEEKTAIELELEYINGSSELNNQLSELYAQLRNSTSDTERDAIQSQILAVEKQRPQMYLNSLYDKLGNATSDAERQVIQNRIEQHVAEMERQEVSEQFDALYEARSNAKTSEEKDAIDAQIKALDDLQEQKYLASLYSKLEKATSDEQKEALTKEINDYKESMALEVRYDELSEKLSKTTNEAERKQIRAELRELQDISNQKHLDSLYDALENATSETQKFEIKQEIQRLNSAYALDNKLDELCEQLNSCTNIHDRTYLEAQINEIRELQNQNMLSGMVENLTRASSIEERNDAYKELNKHSLRVNYDIKLQQLYQYLANSTTDEAREQIQDEIDAILEKYNEL